jgi:hypothetical protein
VNHVVDGVSSLTFGDVRDARKPVRDVCLLHCDFIVTATLAVRAPGEAPPVRGKSLINRQFWIFMR